MTAKVRLGFIGCGIIVERHLDHGVKDFDDVEFVGWCASRPKRAQARREQVGGHGEVFTNVDQMLDQAKPDAVVISLPPDAHGAIEASVIKRRIPFMVEKPVALDVDTARRIRDSVAERGIITSTAYMNRYRDSVNAVREALLDETLVVIEGRYLSNGMGAQSWWPQKHLSGGQFLEQTTHLVDQMRYMTGAEVEWLCASPVTGKRCRPEFYTIEDASLVQMRLSNGAAAAFTTSCVLAQGRGVGMRVLATEMCAKFSGWEQSVTVERSGRETITIPGEANIFAKEFRAFIDAVKTGDPSTIKGSYEDGYRATVISCAANESMETGRAVEVVY